MKDFFLGKIEYDFHLNKSLSYHLEKYEDEIPKFCLKSMSHIINAHHIWLSRLFDVQSESDFWDVLPIDYFIPFHKQNYEQTCTLLEDLDLHAKDEILTSNGDLVSEDTASILYHMLTHSVHHRAQIIKTLKESNLPVPSLELIVYY